LAGERILVIDDHSTTRQLLKAVLEKKGHKVDLAPTTADALEKINTGQPNLIILLDIDGTKLLEFRNQESQLTLVPVMVLTSKGELEKRLRGVLVEDVEPSKSVQWDDLTTQVDSILDLGKRKVTENIHSNGQSLSKRLLQYLEQNKITEVVPVGKKEAKLGYEYPEAAKVVQPEVVGGEIEALEELAEKNYLNRVTYDVIHVCPWCGHHDLNFRDICPQCKSIEVRSVNVIVHIKCGYRALEYEFNQNGKKVCPACHRTLSVEGIDFEKANRPVFECVSCRKRFSKLAVSCRCINCNQTFDASKSLTKKIYSYHYHKAEDSLADDLVLLQNYIKNAPSMTPAPKESPNLQMQIEKDFAEFGLETVNWQYFTHQIQHEIKRARKNNSSFSILKVALLRGRDANLESDTALPQPVLRQVIVILKKCLRDLDVIHIKNPHEFVILLPETPLSMAKILARRLQNYMHNLKLSTPVEVSLSGYPEDGKEVGELLDILKLKLAVLNPEIPQATIQMS
jgi:CheY-like chemotaxis protein